MKDEIIFIEQVTEKYLNLFFKLIASDYTEDQALAIIDFKLEEEFPEEFTSIDDENILKQFDALINNYLEHIKILDDNKKALEENLKLIQEKRRNVVEETKKKEKPQMKDVSVDDLLNVIFKK